MAGPYCTNEDVRAQVEARLGQAAASDLPQHWDPLYEQSARRGYQRIAGLLVGQGYTITQLDTWSGRATYNLDYAIAYAFMYGSFRRGEDAPSPKSELERLDKELAKQDPPIALIDDSGGVIEPAGTPQGMAVSFGRSAPFTEEADVYDAWRYGTVGADPLSAARDDTNRGT